MKIRLEHIIVPVLTAAFALTPALGLGSERDEQKESKREAREVRRDARQEERAGRLTPEQRRDLRQQVRQAGGEVYNSSPKN